MKEVSIHGFRVKYEDNARTGRDYLLYDLDREEAWVFFEHARTKKYAKFEDDREGQYTLSYNHDGTYILVRR